MSLTPDQRFEFDVQGYLHLRGVLPPSEIELYHQWMAETENVERNALAKLTEAGVQLGWGLTLRAQGVRMSQIEERILEGRPPLERNRWLAGELGDGDASIGARGHGGGVGAASNPGF